MRPSWWRAAVLSAACCMPGCAGGGDVTDEFDLRCVQTDWGTYIVGMAAPGIEVGATATAAVFLFGSRSLQDECVSRFLASVTWAATVPGIVSIRPGNLADRAIVTGQAVGETRLGAQITFTDGSTKGTTANETVRVVPATTPH